MVRNMHLATTKDGLGTRLVVAYKQNPKDPLKALVINVDKIIRNVDRDELLIMVQSPEGSKERDFIDYIHKKGLLQYYHENKFFEAMDVDDVIMTPDNNTRIPLRTVLDAIRQQSGLAPLPTKAAMESLSEANPLSQAKKSELLNQENNAAVARSILVQAKMLMDDVNRKLDEALSIDPTLRDTVDQIRYGRLNKPITVDVSQTTKSETKTEKTKKAGARKALASVGKR